MSVVHSQDSEYAKERRRWEATHTEFGPPGKPFVFKEYPAMMYKAGRNTAGKPTLLEHQVAQDEHEQRNLESRGFVAGGPAAAMAALERDEFRLAELAAERNFHEARMSEQAQAEGRAVNERAGMRHVPSVPETPIKRRQWKAKKLAEEAIGTIGE